MVGAELGVVRLPTGHPDEERRLLYGAMTRSTEFLFLTCLDAASVQQLALGSLTLV